MLSSARQPHRTPNTLTPRKSASAMLRVGFLLTPRFTLTAFAGFIDALRLAADEGDRSRQVQCEWAILGGTDELILSSCGARLATDAPLELPASYDYLVVVGGLMHNGQHVPKRVNDFLLNAASTGVKLVGLCTGSFVLARLGLLDGYLSCVSWFHRDAFIDQFPQCRVVSNQMFVVDRDRLTCAGGTSVVHLAAQLIEQHIGRVCAVKALRIMLEEQPLPSRTLQPEAVLSRSSKDTTVHKAMLMLEQCLLATVTIESLCSSIGIGRRQLERRFRSDIGMSPAEYRQRLRLERGHWLLLNTDFNVTEVALECGFQHSAHFARAVRQFYGASPIKLRQMAVESRAVHS